MPLQTMFIRFVALIALMTAFNLPAQARGDVALGKAVVEKYACASCHGADFNKTTDPTYPRLAGQHYDYLVHALRAYKRPNDLINGRQNAIMQGFAGQLTPADIDNVASYLSSLPSDLVTKR